MAVLPSNSISTRDLVGRFISSRNGNCTCLAVSGLLSASSCARSFCLALLAFAALLTYRAARAAESPYPTSILPFQAMVCTPLQACDPPRAAICLSMTCAAVSFAARGAASAASKASGKHRPATAPRNKRPCLDILTNSSDLLRLINHESVGAKWSDHDIDAVSTLDQPALVGERHPIRPAHLGRRALAQLPDLFHRRHHQAHPPLRIDQRRLDFLVVQHLGQLRVQHAPGKADHLAGLGPL